MRIKGKTMEQWINLHQNNNFVNQWSVPLLCEKSEAIDLVLPGLMSQAGWLADEIVLNYIATR